MPDGKLSETGTRYEHWQELRELFLEGVDAVDRIRPFLLGDIDKLRKKHLQAAADLIARQIEIAGNHERVKWDTVQQVNGIKYEAKDKGGTKKDS